MTSAPDPAEQEILAVERRLVGHAERLGTHWREWREITTRKYALPGLAIAALAGGTAMYAALGKRRPTRHVPTPVRQDGSTLGKVLALASLVGTLQKLPLQPLLAWLDRRTGTDSRTGTRPMPGRSRSH